MMKCVRLTILLSGLVLASSCAPNAVPPSPALTADAATYSGAIPCADCAGQRLTLTLFPDGTYRERLSYLGTEREAYELGRWSRDGDDLELRSGRPATQRLRFDGADRLRLLDIAGGEIQSPLNYALMRQPRLDPIPGPFRLRGEYRYLADAASFRNCATGTVTPALLEGDHAALERAYLAARGEPGASLIVTFIGRFEQRALEPGAPEREQLFVEHFEKVWPGEECSLPSTGIPDLVGTIWRAVEIDGDAVPELPAEQALELSLSGEGSRASGSTGCNRLFGTFSNTAGSFRFLGLATTRRACFGEVATREAAFVAALNSTVRQRNNAGALELLDASAKVRVRFRPVASPSR